VRATPSVLVSLLHRRPLGFSIEAITALTQGLDVNRQYRTWPAMLSGTLGTHQLLCSVFQLEQPHQLVIAGQSSNSLLDDCHIEPSLGKATHGDRVGLRTPFRVGANG
jgi:hypothetical protein